MNTNVWTEPGGHILKENLRQEARKLHQMHQPPARMEDWLTMRKKMRQQLLEAAGTFPAPPKLDIREHGTLKFDGFRIVKLTYQSRPGLRVTANLYVPAGPGPFPGILKVPGHYGSGKIAAGVSVLGCTLAREGFVVLIADPIGSGERGTKPGKFEHHGHQGVQLLLIGETLLGMRVYENMRGIDLLQSLGYVDGNRIGVTGCSGGGNHTMWISALDPRVKVSVPVANVGTFEAYVTNGNCWCETLPDCLKITEQWGLLAMIAPNPLLIITAARESITSFLMPEMLRSYAGARKIYALHGVEERIAYCIPDEPHGYHPDMRRHALGWLKYWLMGEGPALPRALPKVPDVPERKLMCFPGKSRPKEVRSLVEYVSLRAQELKKEFLKQPKLNLNRKINELARTIRLPGGPDYINCGRVVRDEAGGRPISKFTVESEKGVLIPCVLLLPHKKYSSVVIAAHPDGKDACFKQAAVQDVLAEGKALCMVDLRDIGESRWSVGDDQICLFSARAAVMLGRTIMGDWVKDLSAVRAALKTIVGPKRTELMGFGDTGIPGLKETAALARGAVFGNGETAVATLAAAALDKRFDGVTVVNLLSTYVINGAPPVQRHSILAPGVLKWGDVSLIAAMANCPVQVNSLVNPSGQALSAKERSAWMKEAQRMSARLGTRCRVQMR